MFKMECASYSAAGVPIFPHLLWEDGTPDSSPGGVLLNPASQKPCSGGWLFWETEQSKGTSIC